MEVNFFNNFKVFLVAGGYDGVLDISSTETLIEGGQAWNFQQSLPSENGAPKGISLFNTVIITGIKSKFHSIVFYQL